MLKTIQAYLIALLLTSLFWGCDDHRLPPPSSRFRLKTASTFSTNNQISRTDFNYDQLNRQASFTREDGSRGIFLYDEQSRYKQLDEFSPTDTTRTYFTYDSTSNDFIAKTVRYNSTTGQEDVITIPYYTIDVNKRLVNIKAVSGYGSPYETYDFSYTGDNITREGVLWAPRRYYEVTFYYDDKPNPFYGLIGPNISGIQRFSRNNLTKFTTTISPYSVSYQYEYNSQGLPTKVTNLYTKTQTTFTYEAY